MDTIRYYIEHNLLPTLLYNQTDEFLKDLSLDENFLYDLVDTAYQFNNKENPYKKEDFQIERYNRNNEFLILKIIMPEPENISQCYHIYIFFNFDFKNLAYYVIEASYMDCIICEWDENHKLIDHGDTTIDNEEDFDLCIQLYKDKYHYDNIIN